MNTLKKLTYGSIAGLATTQTALADINFGQGNVSDDLKGKSGNNAIETIQSLVSTVLGLLGIIAVIFAIYGGFLILTSGTNEDNVGKGKKVIVSALIGLVVIFLAWTIVTLVLNVLNGSVVS